MDPALLSRASVPLVCDDPSARRAWADLLTAVGADVREFSSQDAFLTFAESQASDAPMCAIVDLGEASTAAFELHRRLVERGSSIATVIIAGGADVPRIVSSMRHGAVAVFQRPARDQDVWHAVQEGLERSDEEVRRRQHHRLLESRLRALSPQDRQVLQLLMEGCKNRIIAKRLDVSLRTVENRRRKIFDVMEADSVAELARLVVEFEHGLLPSPPSMGSWLSLPFERVA